MAASRITFSELFNLAFLHDFYADGKARSLRVTPSPEALEAMQRSQLRLDQSLGTSSIWHGQLAGAPTSDGFRNSDPITCFLYSEDPDFLAVTDPVWPDPRFGPDWLLYFSNQQEGSSPEQTFAASKLETLRAVRNSLTLPSTFRPGEPLHFTRCCSNARVWSGTVSNNLITPMPILPTGKYLAQSGESALAFCPVPDRKVGRIGLVEISLEGASMAAPLSAALHFTNKSVIVEYVIEKSVNEMPLDQASIQNSLGEVKFSVLPRTNAVAANVTRFRSLEKVPIKEQPHPAHQFDLVIPKYNLKVPDPVPLPSPSARSLRMGDGQEFAELRVFV